MSAGRDTTVRKLYAEVFRGRYAHRDGYYACRALLAAGLVRKPNAQGALLRYVPPVTTTRVEVPVEPPPGPPVEKLRERSRQVEGLPEEAPERQQLEADLVAAYAAHLRQLGHRVVREEPSAAGPCDLLDRTVRLLAEAKSDGSRGRVRAAWAQALDYRDELNAESDEERAPVERVAILTPVPPCEGAVAFLQRRLDDCGGTLTLIYQPAPVGRLRSSKASDRRPACAARERPRARALGPADDEDGRDDGARPRGGVPCRTPGCSGRARAARLRRTGPQARVPSSLATSAAGTTARMTSGYPALASPHRQTCQTRKECCDRPLYLRATHNLGLLRAPLLPLQRPGVGLHRLRRSGDWPHQGIGRPRRAVLQQADGLRLVAHRV